MQVFIGSRNPSTQVVTCDAGHTYFPEQAVVLQGFVGDPCPECYDRGLFSDLWKDEYGVRPNLSHFTISEMRSYIDSGRAWG